MVIGLLMWVLATNSKVSEAGRILFACGAFVTVWVCAGATVHIGSVR
jgi:hypothetical protein